MQKQVVQQDSSVDGPWFIPGTYDDTYQEDQVICGGASILTANGYAPLRCGRWWECEPCLKNRTRHWSERLSGAMSKHPGNWRAQKVSYDRRRSVQRSLDVYISFPQEDGVVFLSPELEVAESDPVPSDVESDMCQWVQTPRDLGVRISTSRGLAEKKPDRPPQETYIVKAAVKRVTNELIEAKVNLIDYGEHGGRPLNISLRGVVEVLHEAGIKTRRVDDSDSCSKGGDVTIHHQIRQATYEIEFLSAVGVDPPPLVA